MVRHWLTIDRRRFGDFTDKRLLENLLNQSAIKINWSSSKYLWWLIMIGDLAGTFVKLCHVLCNFSAIVIFSVVKSLQRGCKLCWTGVYILRMAFEKTTQQVWTFDESILQQKLYIK